MRLLAVVTLVVIATGCAETPQQIAQEGLRVEITSKKTPRLAALCATRLSERSTIATFISQMREMEKDGDYEVVVRYSNEQLGTFALIQAEALGGATRISLQMQPYPKHIVDELVDGIRARC